MYKIKKVNISAQKLNQTLISHRIYMNSFQRGSILIGIIIAMVVMAVLGTGMLYLTTTSTYNELFFGNHSDAYFVAESGGRFAKSVIRDAYANDISKLNAINNNQTFTLTNGNSFQIKDLLRSGNPETITFSSIGMVGLGLMQAKRQINYIIQPANQTGGMSTGPSGPIDFDDYPQTTVTGGGSVTILENGMRLNINTAAGGAGKKVTILSNNAWVYPENYAVQVKTYGSGNKAWHMGLFVNMKKNGPALPYGYGVTFFNVWDNSSQLDFKSPLPESAVVSKSPIVLLWQNDQSSGLNWIAYAPLNEEVLSFGIYQTNAWYLGYSGLLQLFPTILIKVSRNTGLPASNDIQVYLAGPANQPLLGNGDTNPINYSTRKGYEKWSVANAATRIKWPSNNGSWPASNDYFTMINSEDLSAPVIAKWFKNPNVNVEFHSDTTTVAGNTYSNALIRSTIMTGTEYAGVGLFIDPCGSSPQGDFINLGFQSGTGTVSDGSGTEFQY